MAHLVNINKGDTGAVDAVPHLFLEDPPLPPPLPGPQGPGTLV